MGDFNTDFAVVSGRSRPSLTQAKRRPPLPNAVLCTDGHAKYEPIAKGEWNVFPTSSATLGGERRVLRASITSTP
jgi:hypothetical protein